MQAKQVIDKIIQNFPQKLISFVMALMLFALYRVSLYKTVTISVPIQIIQDKSMCVSGRTDFACRVTVRSTPENIASITEKNIQATADISWLSQTGTYNVMVNASLSSDTPDLEPVELRVWPEHIQVKIEKTVLSYVPIQPLLSGSVAKGYEITNCIATPDTVLVSGPESIVSSLEYINTQKVDVAGQKSSASKKVALLNINSHIKIEEQKTVNVFLQVEPKISTRQFLSKPIELVELDDRFVATSVIPKIDFELKGPVLLLDDIIEDVKLASVDCKNISKEGTYELPVEIKKVSGLEVNSTSCDSVKITFSLNTKKLETQDLQKLEIPKEQDSEDAL